MIPTPWTVGVRAWTSGPDLDRQGNPVQRWSDPAPLAVHAVAPRIREEPAGSRRWEVVEGLTVYARAGTVVDAHDRVVVDGVDYEVVGDVARWDRGPWDNPVAGVTIDIVRVKG